MGFAKLFLEFFSRKRKREKKVLFGEVLVPTSSTSSTSPTLTFQRLPPFFAQDRSSKHVLMASNVSARRMQGLGANLIKKFLCEILLFAEISQSKWQIGLFTRLIGHFRRRVKLYYEILFIGLGPEQVLFVKQSYLVNAFSCRSSSM